MLASVLTTGVSLTGDRRLTAVSVCTVKRLRLSHLFISIAAMKCPTGLEYKQNGSPCRNSCVMPFASNNCPLAETETCDCPTGTVVSFNGECVAPTDCQCLDGNGTVHEVGLFRLQNCPFMLIAILYIKQTQYLQIGEVWLSDDCVTEFQCYFCADCPSGHAQISSSPHTCGANEYCSSGVCEGR